MHKGEFLDFLDICVRNVYILQQFAIVTGMGIQHLEIPR